MLVDYFFLLILQLFPPLQVRDIFDFFGGGPGLVQLLKDALDMVPLLHVAAGLGEGIGNDLPNAHHALHDLLLALLAARRASLGVVHTVALLCHVRSRAG